MSPKEAAKRALEIAREEKLVLGRIADIEAGAEGAQSWFARNIARFFSSENPSAGEDVSEKDLRRYVGWMRTTK